MKQPIHSHMRPFLVCLLFLGGTVSAQQNDYYSLIKDQFTGEIAYSTVAYVEQYWRLAGNPGFDSSIQYVRKQLEQAGFHESVNGDNKTRLTYRIEHRPLDHPAWEPKKALLLVDGDTLLSTTTNRNMLTINSWSTPPGGVEGQLLYVSSAFIPDSLDLKGKILFGDFPPYMIIKQAMKGGAAGILTYSNPDYLQPEKNATSIQFRNIPYDAENKPWALALSFEARQKLMDKIKDHPVNARVIIETEWVDSDELTLIAQIKGSKRPGEELVMSAHVQEPGANDNASGVGVVTEMAVVTAGLIGEKAFDPDRTMTFLWGDEIISTRRYVEEYGKQIKWGLSLDMVGEDTDKTGGTFLIEKMPDPSAIWTRGKDKHTEWGAGEVSPDDMMPHYLNDFVINRFREQGKRTNWQVSTNPFEGGSDHVPFLKADIPGVLFWHFTDQFYHTDNDRLDKVSTATMKNVGTAALVCSYQLLNGDQSLAISILNETVAAAKKRISEEIALSRQAVKELPSGKANQEMIIEAWKEWYLKAAESVADLVDDPKKIQTPVDTAKREINQAAAKFLGETGK